MGSLEKQLRLLKRIPLPFVQYIDKVKEIFYWECMLTGPEDSPYEDGVFKISFFFPNDFPRVPPVVKFVTPIHHPNVSESGLVVLSILRSHFWDPSTAVADIIEAIWKMMAEPVVDVQSVVDQSVLEQYVNNNEVFEWIARTKVEIEDTEFNN